MKKNVHREIGKLILYKEVCNTNYVVYTQFQKLVSESLVIDLNKISNLKQFIKHRVLYFIKSQNFIITKNILLIRFTLHFLKNSSNLPPL